MWNWQNKVQVNELVRSLQMCFKCDRHTSAPRRGNQCTSPSQPVSSPPLDSRGLSAETPMLFAKEIEILPREVFEHITVFSSNTSPFPPLQSSHLACTHSPPPSFYTVSSTQPSPLSLYTVAATQLVHIRRHRAFTQSPPLSLYTVVATQLVHICRHC